LSDVFNRFDPSAYIAAERSEQSQALATGASDADPFDTGLKSHAVQAVVAAPPKPVAKIATIAVPPGENLPWAVPLTEFSARVCPPGIKPAYWDELVNEALLVSREWGAKALAVGWSALDLFGCNPDPLARRVDRDGLVKSVVEMRCAAMILGMDDDTATLRGPNGSTLRHYRKLRAIGSVPLWHAFPMTTGP
jgi:hypothetical protein